MRILILEDETLAAEKIANLLKDIDPKIDVVGELKSIEAALVWFNDHEVPDLVISDIRLLDGLSFEIFSQTGYQGPVIFTTAYDQYAIKAFEVNSIDYLLKPVQKEKLETSLGKFKNLARPVERPLPYQDLLSAIEAQKKEYKTRFMIRSGQKILAVPVEKIAYFYSHNKLTYIVTHDHKKYPLDQPLEVIDPQLDPKLFFRANRQFIVKFDAIDEIHPYFKGRIKIDLKPATEMDIVISSDKTPGFKKWLDV